MALATSRLVLLASALVPALLIVGCASGGPYRTTYVTLHPVDHAYSAAERTMALAVGESAKLQANPAVWAVDCGASGEGQLVTVDLHAWPGGVVRFAPPSVTNDQDGFAFAECEGVNQGTAAVWASADGVASDYLYVTVVAGSP